MSVIAVVGANWGDEGKGKMIDYLAENADYVVRFQGGNNAGHTVINQYGKFALHLLPSGICYPQAINILGPGVAVNVAALAEEIRLVEASAVPKFQLLISDRAQVVMPYHLLFDRYEEERLGKRQFGSTKSGMAPFYADKYYKVGIQTADLFSPDRLREKVVSVLEVKNLVLNHLYKKPTLSVDQIVDKLLADAEAIKPFIADTTTVLQEAVRQGKRVILEGQLGSLRDPDHGIYPFTTSSSTLAGFAPVGAGIAPYAITDIVAVVKAYSTCVGAGPFVSEIFGQEAEELRQRGGDCGEYGATTGRPRRIGWFDAVASRYGCKIQGATEVALTLLDVLGYRQEIPVCTAYKVDGSEIQEFPRPDRLERAQPVVEMLPGWNTDISQVTSFAQLPDEAKHYVKFIEERIEVPVTRISVGPRRENTIIR